MLNIFPGRLPGPPLTRQTAFTTLMQHGVTVGLGTTDNCLARNIRFDLGWVRSQSPLPKMMINSVDFKCRHHLTQMARYRNSKPWR